MAEQETVESDGGDDAFLAAWPADLRQAWLALRLPSVAEQLIASERLAAEVRRQNQELRRLASALPAALPAASPADDGGRLAAALEAVRSLSDRLARAGVAALIEVCEASDRHAAALAQAVAALIARSSARTWFGRRRTPPADALAAIQAQVDGARLVARKALAALADAGVEPLAPAIGASFDPENHRCVATRPGPAGRILAVERAGWMAGAARIRPAEVVVGNDQEQS